VIALMQDDEGMVTCLDETRHGLEDGDFVTFTEVKGMDALNGCEPRKVTVKGGCNVTCLMPGPYTFTIGSTKGLGTYKSGGLFTQVKMPKIIKFVSGPRPADDRNR
jgi:ubiquitin-activating enzyme E1